MMMKNLCKFSCLVLVLLMCFNLVGCGKVSAPMPIEGSGYPHTYPRH